MHSTRNVLGHIFSDCRVMQESPEPILSAFGLHRFIDDNVYDLAMTKKDDLDTTQAAKLIVRQHLCTWRSFELDRSS